MRGRDEDGCERRKLPRVPLSARAPVIHLPVTLMLGDEKQFASIVNIAEEGMFVRSDADVEAERPVHVCFLVGADRRCEARGHVVRKATKGFGVRLTDPDDEFRYLVRELAAADRDERADLLSTIHQRDVFIETG